MNEETSQILSNLIIKRESQIAVTGTDMNRAILGYNNLNIIVNSIIKILQDEIEFLTTPPKPVLPKQPKQPTPSPDK